MFPNILYVGNEVRTTTQWRVPIDDEHTYHVSLYTLNPAPGHTAPKQDVPSYRYTPLFDDELITFNQDFMAWSSQGPMAQRHLEKLGQSDVGVILFRKQLKREMQLVQDGGEPMNVFRNPKTASNIPLPMEKIKHRQYPDGNYRPGEDGVSPDEDLLREVSATWAGVYEGKVSGAPTKTGA